MYHWDRRKRTDLREVDGVIIDAAAHVHPLSAAALGSRIGAVLVESTVTADGERCARLVWFATDYATLRAWATKGTGDDGAWSDPPCMAGLRSPASSTARNALPAATEQSAAHWTRSVPREKPWPGPR